MRRCALEIVKLVARAQKKMIQQHIAHENLVSVESLVCAMHMGIEKNKIAILFDAQVEMNLKHMQCAQATSSMCVQVNV